MQFVSALRKMAAECDYFSVAELDNRVCDQFVTWVAASEIRKRLFQKPPTKTLADRRSQARDNNLAFDGRSRRQLYVLSSTPLTELTVSLNTEVATKHAITADI